MTCTHWEGRAGREGKRVPWYSLHTTFASGPQNVPHIWEEEHQVGARAAQGGLPGPEVSPHDVRWGCLTLNLLPTSEGQVWALEEKVFQQVFNPFHRAQQDQQGG